MDLSHPLLSPMFVNAFSCRFVLDEIAFDGSDGLEGRAETVAGGLMLCGVTAAMIDIAQPKRSVRAAE